MIVYEIYDVVEYFYENKLQIILAIVIFGISLYVGLNVGNALISSVTGVVSRSTEFTI